MRTIKNINKKYYITNKAKSSIFEAIGGSQYITYYSLFTGYSGGYVVFERDESNSDVVRYYLSDYQVKKVIEYHRDKLVFDYEYIKDLVL
jgi:hypothetical protein